MSDQVDGEKIFRAATTEVRVQLLPAPRWHLVWPIAIGVALGLELRDLVVDLVHLLSVLVFGRLL